jgi:carboxypeptidase D
MVGFDVPHVAHDMMLRFMNVDFTSILSGSAMISSSVGDNVRLGLTATPESGGTKVTDETKGSTSDYTPLEGTKVCH